MAEVELWNRKWGRQTGPKRLLYLDNVEMGPTYAPAKVTERHPDSWRHIPGALVAPRHSRCFAMPPSARDSLRSGSIAARARARTTCLALLQQREALLPSHHDER